jgi:tRNA(Ile)-lysidine synthetase-like protein
MKLLPILPNKFTVCVSGGVDSIAAADFLSRKRKRDITLFYFNHGTEFADAMEKKVVAFAEFIRKPLVIGRTDKKLKTEDDFRQARLDYIYSSGWKSVVTAHHLDDAVESYLMNMFRGHYNWKVPIKPISKHTLHNGESLDILHPFLLNPKKELINYARYNQLGHFIFEDPSNKISFCRRNFIRNELLPLLNQKHIVLNKIVKKQYLDYASENYKQRYS